MRRKPRYRSAAWLALMVAPALLGAGLGDKKVPRLDKEKPPKVEETVGDIAIIRASDNIQVEGVGLVIGLNDTGSNPEPSAWRTELLDRMRKAQVPSPESWLESPTTSLVLVRGTIPVGVTTKDRFDIELSLTPASTTTSLEGGHLLLTELKVVQVVDGRRLDGQVMAEAYGPVMAGTAAKPEEKKAGRVLGGARAKRDLPYQLVLKPERQGYRTVSMLQAVINTRFFTRKGIEQVGMAEAKRPELIVLNVPAVYHHNQYRYFQVVQRMPMVDTPALRGQRQEKWAKELLDPKTSGAAALQLEGIGRNAVPALQEGLKSTSPQVRFFAAEAMAYLNDPGGADELARAAVEQPEFRAEALAALAAMDHSASVLRLRELMSQADPKVRYGAFNALRTLDEHDASLGRVRLGRRENAEPEDDGMAMKIRSTPRRVEAPAEDPFDLYVVDCEGPPLVHASRTRRCEIVIFGGSQKLHPPLVLGGTGPILLNASDADERIQVTRIGAGAGGAGRELHVETSTLLGDVLLQVSNLGATYPEILNVLQAADRQKNLEGPLVIDALPDPQRLYEEAQVAGVDAASKRDEAVKRTAAEGPASGPDEKASAPGRRNVFQRMRDRIRR